MSGLKPIKISHVEVLAQLERIVTDTSPYRPVFTGEAGYRLLLWGFDVPLHEQGFRSLCRTLRTIGDEKFVYGQIERFREDDDDWIVSCNDFPGYDSVEAFVESLLCSLDGQWVVLCSSEGHSVAAATSQVFTDALARELGVQPLEDALDLVSNWREIYDIGPDPSDLRAGVPDWIPSLIKQTLEPEIAATVLSYHAARARQG